MNKPYKTQSKPTDEVINLDYVNPQYPIDSAAERALIASLIDSPHLLPEALLQVGGTQALGNEGYQTILSVMQALYAENKPIKVSSIIQTTNKAGKTKMLIERGINLMDLPREATATDCIETCIYLRGLWVKRQAVDASNEIRSAVAANEPVDKISDLTAKLHDGIANSMAVGVDKMHGDFVREWFNKIEKAAKNPGTLTGVTMGLGKFNKHLAGWQESDIIMIAGRPAMGKTVAGVYFADEAARAGVPVAYLSLEMAAWTLVNRQVSKRTGVPYSNISKGKLAAHEWTALHHKIGQIENLPIYWYDDSPRDIADLSYMLINWQRKYGIKLIIIDYVQLIEDRTVKGTNEYEILTSVSKKLKKLQRRLNIPIIELAQLNRSLENRNDRRGRASDLKSTGQFEQDASIIMTLYREDAYAEEEARERSKESGVYEEPLRNNKLEFNIVKNRDGYTGTITTYCDVALNQIFDEAPVADLSALNKYPETNTDNWYSPKDTADF